MPPTIRLAIRDWDYMTPIVVGDVRSTEYDIVIDRVDALVGDFTKLPGCDGAEISFGRYTRARAQGDHRMGGVPHFLMRGFRHRCIITAKSSPITSIAGLAGKAIGMDGWPDSGHTWTRALLQREGIGLDDVTWWEGPLTGAGKPRAPAGTFPRVQPVPAGETLVDMLCAGTLDAAFAPFMPPGFHDPASPLRPLLPDYRTAEAAYARATGYVPGMHILALHPETVATHPTLPGALSELIDESTRVWMAKRTKYAETTPWMLDELGRCAADLPPGWDRNGFDANEPMIDAFAEALFTQKLTPHRLTPRDLFPEAGS